MQYVQRWLQPSCTLMNARDRIAGACCGGRRLRAMARTWSAMPALSGLAKIESTVVYAPGFASTLQPVSTRCAPGSSLRSRPMRCRVVASACVLVWGDAVAPAGGKPARKVRHLGEVDLASEDGERNPQRAIQRRGHAGRGAAAASRSPAPARSSAVATAPARRLGSVRAPRWTLVAPESV